MENINYTDDPVGLHQDPQEEYQISKSKSNYSKSFKSCLEEKGRK